MESESFLSERPGWVHQSAWNNPYGHINTLLHRSVASMVAAANVPIGARILDFGCGVSPYRSCFPADVEYVRADLPGNREAHLEIGPASELGAASGQFDVIVSTQVLEHVAHPDRYLAECNRLAKPGGRLILTTHGLMVYHRDPVDYWRWTHEGLRRVVEQAGFRVDRSEGLMGLSAVALQLFQHATVLHVPRVMRSPYVAIMQGLVRLFDRLHSPVSRAQNALVFALLATRVSRPPT